MEGGVGEGDWAGMGDGEGQVAAGGKGKGQGKGQWGERGKDCWGRGRVFHQNLILDFQLLVLTRVVPWSK